jgi:hypothetical protein
MFIANQPFISEGREGVAYPSGQVGAVIPTGAQVGRRVNLFLSTGGDCISPLI